MTSGVIFVVRMHRTAEPLALRALKHLTQNNIPVIGGVVIGDNDPAGGYGHHHRLRRYCRDDSG
jgi:Mrp family chromosome partitioning ATPase